MRILHIHSSFNPGGKELRAAKLINAFGAHVEHAIVSGVPGAMGAAGMIDPAIPVRYPAFPALTGRPSLKRFRQIAEAMRGFDLVLSYNWGAMDAVMAHRLFARRLGLAPLVHHEDGFNHDEVLRLKPSRNLYRRLALPTAAALVVPSGVLEQIAQKVWRRPAVQVRRIANGIPLDDFRRPPRGDALPDLVKQPGELWVGTMAGLRAVKNLPRLVEACAGLPLPWKLVIVGEGPDRPAIEARIRELGMEGRAFLPGHATDPAAVMPLFNLFALSSDSEQFPISVVEAMAAGIPVVATDVGDIRSMVAQENRPYVEGITDVTGLSVALARLTADAQARASIGAANRSKAEAEYDEQRMIAAYRATYGAALGSRSFP